ncbi:MAG TPA: amino acid permease [Candidatus Nanopelagicales bacterium]|nr:amino acid permease [Candidatus Nanopelagicales bacterium]
MADIDNLNDDERMLAELGYKQELHRSWSGFSNFAISFSIISILAGCFTTFYFGWDFGGPVAISLGWPFISFFILLIGFCMSELVSAYPTSGGIYWWASKLGSVKAGYYTGWLNLVGLVAIVASVAYGAATYFDLTMAHFSDSWAAGWPNDASFGPGTSGALQRDFWIFVVVLILVSLVNIFSSHLLSIINNVSVWWHVAGASIIVIILWFFLKDGASHWDVSDVFTYRVNNTGGLFGGETGGPGFWLFVLPLGFLLTQYTITGYDASAHLSEETQGAANSAAKGIWQSIFYSAIGGWILLLSFLFAVQKPEDVTTGFGFVNIIFDQALEPKMAGLVLLIATVGQLFCTAACLTSASRMLFAFSRDGAVPGASRWARLNASRTPRNAVLAVAVVAFILTIPALFPVNVGTDDAPVWSVFAFFAVVSIGVLGLYLAFAIPIYYRWKMGDAFQQGSWNLGNKWKWMAPLAIAEILITSIYFIMPIAAAGTPGFLRGILGGPSTDEVPFTWSAVNYAPIVMVVIFGLLWIGWHVSAKNWFTGPKHTIDLPSGVSSADEIALEHHNEGLLPGEHQAHHDEQQS